MEEKIDLVVDRDTATRLDVFVSMHLSLSRFAHLFTEKMGISPHKFIL